MPLSMYPLNTPSSSRENNQSLRMEIACNLVCTPLITPSASREGNEGYENGDIACNLLYPLNTPLAGGNEGYENGDREHVTCCLRALNSTIA